uniref:Uncharacterized protein n=1 Tax=Arundo donax TaxID=35708 RepID=A0A0A9CAB9_ARUDO
MFYLHSKVAFLFSVHYSFLPLQYSQVLNCSIFTTNHVLFSVSHVNAKW